MNYLNSFLETDLVKSYTDFEILSLKIVKTFPKKYLHLSRKENDYYFAIISPDLLAYYLYPLLCCNRQHASPLLESKDDYCVIMRKKNILKLFTFFF